MLIAGGGRWGGDVERGEILSTELSELRTVDGHVACLLGRVRYDKVSLTITDNMHGVGRTDSGDHKCWYWGVLPLVLCTTYFSPLISSRNGNLTNWLGYGELYCSGLHNP
jgi:hypothetical protein